jgi:hypothetical protein
MPRHISILVTIVVAGLLLLSFTSSGLGTIKNMPKIMHDAEQPRDTTDFGSISSTILEGGSIAPKLENATAKYASSVFLFIPAHMPY